MAFYADDKILGKAMAGNSNSQEKTPDKNESNVTGWYFSQQKVDPVVVNLPRNTEQTMVIIVWNETESTHGKFRSSIMKIRNIMKAYGHGEFFGQAKKNSIRCVDGYWSPLHSMGVLSFDNRQQAEYCMDSNTVVKEWCWLGGVEMYILPTCQPAKCSMTYRFFQMDLYDVKHGSNFVRYLDQMVPLVADHNGLVIAGSQDLGRWRGTRFPNYILLVQWTCPEDFESFMKIGAPLLRDAGAACASRVFFEMDPPANQW